MLYKSNFYIKIIQTSNHEIISHSRSFDFQRIHKKGAFALSSISTTDNPFVVCRRICIKPPLMGTNNVANCYNRFHPVSRYAFLSLKSIRFRARVRQLVNLFTYSTPTLSLPSKFYSCYDFTKRQLLHATRVICCLSRPSKI